MNDRQVQVCLIYRKPRAGYFSIEKIFSQVKSFFPQNLVAREIKMPYGRMFPWEVMGNFNAIRKIKADIFHITGDIHYLVPGLAKKKTILTIHDCVFLYTTNGIKRRLLKYFFLDWPVRHCHIITTISEKTKAEIIRHTGCAPDNIFVIPNPVGEVFYHSSKVFNKDRPVVLFIGSTPNKNLERVIKALKHISCELIIVGALSENQKNLLKLGQISFTQLSGLSEQQLADTYAQCDIVLFPSTYEGFGLPIIEAQKSGRPVITSNISPMKEVAGDGACLVDPLDVLSIRNGLERVMGDNQYREDLITRGLENVKKYEGSVISDAYYQLYKKVIVEK